MRPRLLAAGCTLAGTLGLLALPAAGAAHAASLPKPPLAISAKSSYAYGTQVHHTTGWKDNGHTDINQEVLACGPDNRLAETGWTVHIGNGTAEWTPPPHLEVGQTRTNHHHPERLLAKPDDP